MIPDTLLLLFSGKECVIYSFEGPQILAGLVAIKVCISKRRYGQALPPNGNARITVSWVIRVTALTVLLSIGNV